MNITDKTNGKKRLINIEIDTTSFDDKVSFVSTLKELLYDENQKIQTEYLENFSCAKVLDTIKESYASESNYNFLMAGNFADVLSELTGDVIEYQASCEMFAVENPSDITNHCINIFWKVQRTMTHCPSISIEDTVKIINKHVEDELDFEELKKYVFIY
jgi:hypothetical protein